MANFKVQLFMSDEIFYSDIIEAKHKLAVIDKLVFKYPQEFEREELRPYINGKTVGRMLTHQALHGKINKESRWVNEARMRMKKEVE